MIKLPPPKVWIHYENDIPDDILELGSCGGDEDIYILTPSTSNLFIVYMTANTNYQEFEVSKEMANKYGFEEAVLITIYH
jgi:hypothetical protein